jgi:transcriptional regulator with XRE-family HTH domain
MSSRGWKTAAEVHAELMEDEEFRALWEATAPARALANRVLEYRIEHGLSQTQLARKLGLKQPAVARLEAGEHMPTIKTLLRIAEALDIEILIDIKPSTRDQSFVSQRAESARVIKRVTTVKGSEILLAAS